MREFIIMAIQLISLLVFMCASEYKGYVAGKKEGKELGEKECLKQIRDWFEDEKNKQEAK